MTDVLSTRLREALAGSREAVDEATARGCQQVIAAHRPGWSGWEVAQGRRELERLKLGKNCAYDRHPSIGVSYALDYQGRRTHQAMRVLATPLANATGALRIVDLGCGTGATACAVALIVDGLRQIGKPPEVLVEGVDTSPFMVETAKAVFRALMTEVPGRAVDATFRVVPSWRSVKRTAAKTVVHGGYLLDHLDRSDPQQIARDLLHLGKALEASSVLLTTTAPKERQLYTIETILSENGWSKPPDLPEVAPFGEGTMDECHDVRSAWYREHALELSSTWRYAPPWDRGLPKRVMLHQERGRAGVAST